MATERFDIVITAKGTARTAREIQRIGKNADLTRRALGQMRAALVVFSAARALRGLVGTADALTNLRNRLQSTLGSFGAAVDAQKALIVISRQTRTDLETTADSFARLALGAQDLGISTERLLGITKTLNQAIILSGSTAQEARNAMVQLSQGIASGTLRGDELRSVLEQLPLVARLIAKELGITIGTLRDFGKEGKITSEIVLKALEGNAKAIDDAFGGTTETIGQALSQLNTEFTVFVDKLNETGGVSNALIGVIKTLGSAMQFLSENTTLVNLAMGALVTGGILLLLNTIRKFAIFGTIISSLQAASFAFSLVGSASGVAAGSLAAFRVIIAGILGPIGLFVIALTALGAGFTVFAAGANKAVNDFKNIEAGAVRTAKAIENDLVKSGDQAEEMLTGLQKNIANLAAALDKGSGVPATIARFFGFEVADTERIKKESERQLKIVEELKKKRDKLFAEETRRAFDFDEDDDSFTKAAERQIAKLDASIKVLQQEGKVGQALEKAFQKAGIGGDDRDTAAAERIKRLVTEEQRLKKAIDDRKKAAREAASLEKKRIREAKTFVEQTNNEEQQLALLKKQLEVLRPYIEKLVGRENAERRITKALKDKRGELDAELRQLQSSLFGDILTAREKEVILIADLVGEFSALSAARQKELGGRERLNRLIEKKIELSRKEAAADANAIIASFSLTAKLTQDRERIEKAFKEAREGGQGAVLGGVNEADALKNTTRAALGLGVTAKQTADNMAALTDAFLAGHISADELESSIRKINIALLDQNRDVGSGLESFFIKFTEDATNSAKQIQEVMTTAFKGIEDALVSFTKTGKFEIADLARTIQEQLLRGAIKGLLANLGALVFGSAAPGAGQQGLIGDIFGGGAGGGGIASFIGSLFGAQNGANFTVGPSTSQGNLAGTDNRLVAFRAKDGENVTVTPKGQTGGGQRPITMNLVFPNITSSKGIRENSNQIMAVAAGRLAAAGRRNN